MRLFLPIKCDKIKKAHEWAFSLLPYSRHAVYVMPMVAVVDRLFRVIVALCGGDGGVAFDSAYALPIFFRAHIVNGFKRTIYKKGRGHCESVLV